MFPTSRFLNTIFFQLCLTLCKPSFEPNSINSQKSENLQWEKCRYITDIEKTISDTAQYFHSKHLKNGPKDHEKHFFQWNGVFSSNNLFSKIYCELLLHAKLTKLIGSLYLTPKVNFYSSKNNFKKGGPRLVIKPS